MGRGRPKKVNGLEELVKNLEGKKEEGNKKKKTFSVTLAPDLIEEFDLLAIDYTNGNRSELLEQVIEAFIAEVNKVRNGKKKPVSSSETTENQ